MNAHACWRCSTPLPPTGRVCPRCGADQQRRPDSAPTPAESVTEAAEAHRPSAAAPERSCPAADCGQSLRSDDSNCPYCGRAASATLLQLVSPNGRRLRLVEDEDVEVGRDPAHSPLAADLAAFPNVSRRHMVITARSGGAVVIDVGSSNGTYINDEIAPLPQHTERSIAPGDTIRLAATCTLRLLTDEAHDV